MEKSPLSVLELPIKRKLLLCVPSLLGGYGVYSFLSDSFLLTNILFCIILGIVSTAFIWGITYCLYWHWALNVATKRLLAAPHIVPDDSVFSKPISRQEAIMQAGKEGEERVRRFLQQLSFPNTVINDKYVDNINSVKDAQIDHFVVSEKGIVMIETKNYAGEIDMTDKRQWIQIRPNGERQACTNAYYQSVTHMKIMQNLMKQNGFDDVHLYAIVVFANDRTIYHGLENYHDYVMRYDAMNYFITGLPCCKAMTEQRQKEVVRWIQSFKDANSYNKQ